MHWQRRKGSGGIKILSNIGDNLVAMYSTQGNMKIRNHDVYERICSVSDKLRFLSFVAGCIAKAFVLPGKQTMIISRHVAPKFSSRNGDRFQRLLDGGSWLSLFSCDQFVDPCQLYLILFQQEVPICG
jgi:hypothetical protein